MLYNHRYILKIHGRKYITYQIEHPIKGEISMLTYII